jgi:ubiquinone/menaquinone biosynthesis C-methylase UbiE
MNTREAYDQWSVQYDGQVNPTRDVEAVSFREILSAISFSSVLELGCGTGKNTIWLAEQATQITAVDLSPGMLEIAVKRPELSTVTFIQADITKPWNFIDAPVSLITISLALEHIADLDFFFNQASQNLSVGGHIYLGELHPFKQYAGSKARFDTETGAQVLTCYTHHISDYWHAAQKAGLTPVLLKEYFDIEDAEKMGLPRILSCVFRK